MANRSCHPGATLQIRRAIGVAALQIALAVPAIAQTAGSPSQESSPESQADGERKWFVMDERPSLRFGDALRLDLTSKIGLTVRAAPDEDPDADMEQRRIGVDGRLFEVIDFQIERELGDDEQPWRDVFVELRKWRTMRVRSGRFKIPFGQERLTSISDLEFVHRSIPNEALTPGRDTGLELNGRILARTVTYMAGVFHHDGDVSRGGTDAPGGRTVAARVVSTPFAGASSRALQRVEVGASMTRGDVPEGLNGLRARTSAQYEAVAPVYVFGTRLRFGADAAFTHGPLSVKGEFLQTRDERKRQGLRDEDLPDVVARGWYMSATSFVLGRLKSNGTAPRTPLLGGGIGAIQLAARVESLEFSSHAPGVEALRNPRAANLLPNDIRALTLGVNWFPVRFVKLQWNVIREHVQDPERRPDPSRSWGTTGLFRVQFAL
jgi:phosphate-selective porin OprO and OprP